MSEYGDILFTFTATAAADLSAKRYHFMRFSGAGQVNQASEAANHAVAGVLLNTPAANRFATVARGGEMKITAAASMGANKYITTNGSGRAALVASGSNSMVLGMTRQAASGNGHVIKAEVFLTPYPWPGLAI